MQRHTKIYSCRRAASLAGWNQAAGLCGMHGPMHLDNPAHEKKAGPLANCARGSRPAQHTTISTINTTFCLTSSCCAHGWVPKAYIL
eukprot:1140613-Pelagomonas_calceolata.AAC.2